MKINLLGRKTFASFILFTIVSILKFKLRKFNIEEDVLWKIYYEFDKFMSRSNINKILNEDEFVDVLLDVLKIFEKYFDVQIEKDPNYMIKMVKENIFIWRLYKIFNDFITSDNILKITNSPLTSEVKTQINEKIINTPNLLNYKVKRDVDYAISDYEKLTGEVVDESLYNELPPDGSNAQSLLGGEMRLRAPWADPKNNFTKYLTWLPSYAMVTFVCGCGVEVTYYSSKLMSRVRFNSARFHLRGSPGFDGELRVNSLIEQKQTQTTLLHSLVNLH